MKQAEINETETGIMRALISKREEKASTPPSASDRREGRGGEEGGGGEEERCDACFVGFRVSTGERICRKRWPMGHGRWAAAAIATRKSQRLVRSDEEGRN